MGIAEHRCGNPLPSLRLHPAPLSPAGRELLLALAVALLAAGCHANPLEQPARAQAPAATAPAAAASAAGALPRVAVGPVKRETLRRFTTQPARVLAFEETPLHSRIAAYVEEAPVEIGSVVEPGQILVRLFAPELSDEVQRQQALVAQAKAEVAQSEAAVRGSQAAVQTARAKSQQAEAAVARVTADFVRWESQLTRYRHLAKEGSVTQKLVEETEAQFRAAEAAKGEAAAMIGSAQAAVAEAEAKLGSSEADVEAAKAKQAVAAAAFQAARTMQDYTAIRAPFAGVVTQRHVDTRHFVQPSATRSLLVVARTDKLRVVADLPELDSALAGPGDPATIQVQALGAGELTGAIARTAWALDPANRSLRVEVDLAGDGRLRPGMYATLKILLEERKDVPVIPLAAVVWTGGATHCCRIESGRVKRVPLKLGLRVADQVEVLSGINPGDELVLARADSLLDGQSVEALRSEPTNKSP